MYDETMPDTPIMGPTAGRGPEHLGCGCDRHRAAQEEGASAGGGRTGGPPSLRKWTPEPSFCWAVCHPQCVMTWGGMGCAV